MGLKARSWQGWQIPIMTSEAHGSARIAAIDGTGILKGFTDNRSRRRLRLPGRAPAHGPRHDARPRRLRHQRRGARRRHQAERCDIYTDVDGVYTTDPRIVPKARRLDKVSYEEMLEMASLGAKVLQVRSVELAMMHRVPTYVRSSFDDPADPKLGTLICDEEDIMEQQIVTGIAYSRDEAQITLRDIADKPGIAASIFVPLADANINVDMIIQVVSDNAATTDLTFTVPTADYERAVAILNTHRDEIAFKELQGATDVVKVSPSASACAAMRASRRAPSRPWRTRASTSGRSRRLRLNSPS